MEMTISKTDTDRFSWRRVGMTAKYYGPTIIPWLLLIAGIEAAACVLMSADSPWLFLGSSLTSVALFLVIYFPLVVNPQRQQVMMAMLPSSVKEKFIFFTLLFLLSSILLSVPSSLLSSGIISGDSKVFSPMMQQQMQRFCPWTLLNFTTTLFPTLMCFYCTLRWPGSRAKAVILPILCLSPGFFYGVYIGFSTARLAMESSIINEQELERMILEDVVTTKYLVITYTTEIALNIIMLWLINRKMTNRQF